MNERLLRFRFTNADMMKLWEKCYPNGRTVLNSKTWRGKEPRSCGVVDIHGSGNADSNGMTGTIVVAYRPKGYVYYVGNTKYDGWTAMILDQMRDGTLLDGSGNPLPQGAPHVYLPREVFGETDFDGLEFGEFIDEVDGQGVKRITHEAMLAGFYDAAKNGASFKSGINSEFMAAKRHRPHAKIILTGRRTDSLISKQGDRIINININSPEIEREIQERIEGVVTDFLEGRVSLTTVGTGDRLFVDLSDSLVDCSPNEQGQESRFHILMEYVSPDYLEELARRIRANYRINVDVVEGRRCGLLIQSEPPGKRRYE